VLCTYLADSVIRLDSLCGHTTTNKDVSYIPTEMFLASSHLPSSGLMLSEGVTDWEGRIISREGRGALRHCFSNKGANKEGVTLALGTTTSHLSCSNTTSKILHCLPVTNYRPLPPPLHQLQSTHSARVNF